MPDLVGGAPICKLSAKLGLFDRALDSFDGADRLRANVGALLTIPAVSEGRARVEVEYKTAHKHQLQMSAHARLEQQAKSLSTRRNRISLTGSIMLIEHPLRVKDLSSISEET